MYAHALIDTIRPDHPAEDAVRVLAHWGGMEFVEVTSMTGPGENWTLQLDREQAQNLADALGFALARIDRGRVDMPPQSGTYTQAEAEIEVRDALITRTSAPADWDTVSDAVDVHLGRVEREQGRAINRDVIPHETVFSVLETIIRDAAVHHP